MLCISSHIWRCYIIPGARLSQLMMWIRKSCMHELLHDFRVDQQAVMVKKRAHVVRRNVFYDHA